ncbi:MAG: hypothetical protein ACTSYI_11410 [Promethearchaeota archaeon]
MSENCNQCGESVKYSKSRFCNSCGAEIRPLEVVFAPSLDENAVGFKKYLEQMKISYYNQIYDINLWLAKRSVNLFNARMFLSRNLSILQQVPIPERTEKLEETTLEAKDISIKIHSESELIQHTYQAAKEIFDQGEIVEAKVNLEPAHSAAKKFGFYQWVSDVNQIQTQINDNLSCLHRLQKIHLPENLPPEKVASSLLFSYFKLLQLENFINTRNNDPKTTLKIIPKVLTEMDSQKSILTSKFQELNQKIPDFGFGDKFKYFFMSTAQDISYFTAHFKFNRLLSLGESYSNLPKAWESLQLAQKIVADESVVIYSDKIGEFKIILEKARSLIAQLTEEKEKTVKKTFKLMQKFKFEEAIQVIATAVENLTKYSMNVLIKQLEEQTSVVRYNQEIDTELVTINDIYDLGDYLEAQSQIDALHKRATSSDSKFEVVKNLNTKITKFQKKITLSRTKGESLLIAELDEIWQALMENLTFADSSRILIEKKDLSHKQEYKAAAKKIDSLIKNLELNQQSYGYLQNSEKFYQEGEFAKSKTVMAEVEIRIKKSKKDHFPLIIQKVEDFNNSLSKSISDEENILKDEVSRAQKLVADSLEFFQATEILSNCKNRADIAGLDNISEQIDTISQNFVENQRLQTEQVSFESRIQEGKIQEAKIGLEELLKTVYKNQKIYLPLIKQNLESIIGKLNTIIEEEESAIQKEIGNFHDLMDKSLDFKEPAVIIQDLVRRIKINGFFQYNEILDQLTQKIARNNQKVNELASVQKIFEEGDINVAEKEARKLLKQINGELKKTPRIYGAALIDASRLLNSEIEIAMKDGLDNLSKDFADITKKAQTALDFIEILQKLKNYQIRAQRLGEENLKNQMIVLESQVQYNANLIAKHNSLAAKYQRMEDFLQTLRDIKNLATTVNTDPRVFEQIKSILEALQDRVEDDSSDREERMRNSLQNIIKEELNELNFAKAGESLRGLKETAQGLAITTFNTEINKFLMICQSHKNFKIRAESALVKYKSGGIMEARETLSDVQSDLDHHDGPVLDAMVTFVKSNYDSIHSEITKEIADITKDVKGRLLKLLESKKGEQAYFILEKKLERARYLESKELIAEIPDLMKLCALQFDPMDKKYRKKRKKQGKIFLEKEIGTVLPATQSSVAAGVATAAKDRRSTVQTMTVSREFQVYEKTPEFSTKKELREYKSNLRLKKRARVVKAPKLNENLNNEVRNSMTRARLQAFDRQSNRPQKRTKTICANCGSHQTNPLVVFCDFCGKPL